MMQFLKRIKNIFLVMLLKRDKGTKSEENMNTKLSPKMLYTTLEELPVKKFYKILNEKDLTLLGKGSHEELQNNWFSLLDQYWQLTNIGSYKLHAMEQRSLLNMQNRFTTITAAVMLCDLGQKSGFEALKKFGLLDIDRAKNEINILKTKILIKLARIEAQAKEDVYYNFYRDLVRLEQALNRAIDDNITVAKWIELIKLTKELNNGRNKKK